MKKYILIIISLLSIACGKDEAMQQESEFFGDLVPAEIIVKQGETILQDAVKDNKIILEQGLDYNISVIFKEDVSLQQGDFLKMKSKNTKEFFAHFYGKNLNEINEKVTFKKDGYNDFVLEITQKPVIPNKYTSVKSYGMANYAFPDKDSKTIWIINANSASNRIDARVEFLAPVFFEDDAQKELKVSKQGEGDAYEFSFPNTKILQGEDFIIPIYSLINNEKGEQIGELIFKADNRLFTMETGWRRTIPSDTFNHYSYWSDETSINFFIHSEKKFIILENVNNEIIEHTEIGKDEATKGSVKITFKPDLSEYNQNTIRVFDAYEAELINGELVKKTDAKKYEFFVKIYSN